MYAKLVHICMRRGQAYSIWAKIASLHIIQIYTILQTSQRLKFFFSYANRFFSSSLGQNLVFNGNCLSSPELITFIDLILEEI